MKLNSFEEENLNFPLPPLSQIKINTTFFTFASNFQILFSINAFTACMSRSIIN